MLTSWTLLQFVEDICVGKLFMSMHYDFDRKNQQQLEPSRELFTASSIVVEDSNQYAF